VKVQLKQDRGVFIFGNRRKLNIKKSLNDGSWQPNLYIFEIILFEMKSLKQIDPKETLKKYLPLKGKKTKILSSALAFPSSKKASYKARSF
jgi:hypothetical protein